MTSGVPRDVRLDLLRGLALVAISINHTQPLSPEATAYGIYQFGHLFSFNFTDVFILISGIVCGKVYSRVLIEKGFIECAVKSIRRASEIYAAYIICALAYVCIIWIGSEKLELDLGLHAINGGYLNTIIDIILLLNPKGFFDILSFYIIIMVFLPIIIFFILKNWILTLSISAFIWAFYFVGISIGHLLNNDFILSVLSSNHPLHPLSWQFLFIVGIFFGNKDYSTYVNYISLNNTIVLFSMYFIFTDFSRQLSFGHHYFDQRQYLGPLRIIDLLFVSKLLYHFIPIGNITNRYFLLRVLSLCGKYSLFVFSVSVIINYILITMSAYYQPDRIGYLLMILLSITATIASAYFRQHTKKRRRTLENQASSSSRHG